MFSCIGLKKVPDGAVWFCGKCELQRPALIRRAKAFLGQLDQVNQWQRKPCSGENLNSRLDKVFTVAHMHGWTEAPR